MSFLFERIPDRIARLRDALQQSSNVSERLRQSSAQATLSRLRDELGTIHANPQIGPSLRGETANPGNPDNDFPTSGTTGERRSILDQADQNLPTVFPGRQAGEYFQTTPSEPVPPPGLIDKPMALRIQEEMVKGARPYDQGTYDYLTNIVEGAPASASAVPGGITLSPLDIPPVAHAESTLPSGIRQPVETGTSLLSPLALIGGGSLASKVGVKPLLAAGAVAMGTSAATTGLQEHAGLSRNAATALNIGVPLAVGVSPLAREALEPAIARGRANLETGVERAGGVGAYLQGEQGGTKLPIEPPTEPPKPGEPQGETPGYRARQIIADKEATLEHPGVVTQLPGVKQVESVLNPSISLPRNVTVALNAKGAATASLATELRASRAPIAEELASAWKEAPAAYVGPEKNAVKGTVVDWLEQPQHYTNVSPRLQAAKAALDASSDALPATVNQQFGTNIGTFKGENPGASYVPHVESKDSIDAAAEKIAGTFTKQSTASKLAPAKTRLYETLAERSANDPKFQAETDIRRLVAEHDQAVAQMAGNETFKTAVGGKNRLEVLQETHPALYTKMTALRTRLGNLQGNLSSVNQRAGATVADFLRDPESMTLGDLADSLDVKIAKGRQAGMGTPELQQEIAGVRQQIRGLRPAWDNAKLGDYKLSQVTYQYHSPEEVKAMDDVLRTRLNMGQGVVDAIDEVRQTAFAGDFSPLVGVQAPIGMMADPVAGARAIRGMGRELFDPGAAIQDAMRTEPELVAGFTEASGRAFGSMGSEFREAGRGLERLPVVGKGIGALNERMMTAVQYLQYQMWKNNRTVLKALNPGVSDAQMNADAWNNVSKVIPSLNPAERGASVLQAKLERAPVVSTSFIGGPATLIKDAASGMAKLGLSRNPNPLGRVAELSGREQLAIMHGAMLTGSLITLSVGSQLLLGKSPEEAVKTALDPNSRRFLSIGLPGGYFVPVGGPFRSLAKAMVPVKVGETNGIPVFVPFGGLGRYGMGRLGPVAHVGVDLARNRDFTGREIYSGDFPKNILQSVWYSAEQMLPLTAGAVSQGVRTGQGLTQTAVNTAGQFAGVNPGQPTAFENLQEARQNVLQEKGINGSYEDLKAKDSPMAAQIDADPRIQSALGEVKDQGRPPTATDTYFQKADEARTQFTAAQTKDDTKLATGAIDGKTWRDAYRQRQRDLYQRRQGITDALGQQFKDQPAPQGSVNEAIQNYFNVNVDDYTENDTVNWDKFFAARDQAMSGLSGGDKQRAMEFIHRYDTPAVSDFRKAQGVVSDYFNTPKYKGLSIEESNTLDKFSQSVADVQANYSYAHRGRSLPTARAIRVAAKQENLDPKLRTFALRARNEKWAARHTNPARDQILMDNQDTLARFYPDLVKRDLNRKQEAKLSKSTFATLYQRTPVTAR